MRIIFKKTYLYIVWVDAKSKPREPVVDAKSKPREPVDDAKSSPDMSDTESNSWVVVVSEVKSCWRLSSFQHDKYPVM